jgi:hypothetical protein
MSAPDRLGVHLEGLSAQDQRRLESWVQAFGQGWDERRWGQSVGRMPAGPLRRPALIELVKIDLARRWQKGHKVGLDYYLKHCPELTFNGQSPLDLRVAEQKAGEQFGDVPEIVSLPDHATSHVEQTRVQARPEVSWSSTARPEVGAADALQSPEMVPTFMTRPVRRPKSRRRASAVIVPPSDATPVRRSGAWIWAVGAVAGIGMVAVAWFRGEPAKTTDSAPTIAETKPVGPLHAADPVRTVSVTISVGNGSDLTERIGLDLGLGFPLWLGPIGSDSTRPAPFGAMPQSGPTEPVLKASGESRFTFAADGEPGGDVLRTTRQLLGGVLVGDIRRIGFIGPVTTDWDLAGYEVKINDRTVAAGTPSIAPRKLLAKTLAELAEVGVKISPLAQKHAELRERLRAKTATPDEVRRLTDLDAVLSDKMPEKARLETRMQGKAPWFIAANPELPTAPAGKPFQSARVTAFTRAHEGADTRNYVYVTFGAAKYLLGSPAKPLTPAEPQRFDLDLANTPLSDTDIRKCAFGMLAHSEPQGDVPDRWHPRRLVVELNDAVAFDSDKADRNRRSLNAVRLVPPAQLDWVGTPRDIHPVPREVSEWIFASGAGLNVANQPLPLVAADGAAMPKPEPGTIDPSQPTLADPGFTEGAANFPGETPIVIGPPPERDIPADSAVAAGQSPQIRNVRIADGSRSDDAFTIRWGLAGDEGTVDHYEVILVRVRPENSSPVDSGSVNGDQYLLSDHVPQGVRTITAVPAGLANRAFDPLFMVRPLVRSVPANAVNKQIVQQFGSAKPLFPRSPLRPQFTLQPLFWKGKSDAQSNAPPVAAAPPNILTVGRPTGTGTAIWPTGQVECNGVVFSGEGPTPNVIVRLEDPAEQARIWLRTGVLPPTSRPRDISAYIGFADKTPGQIEVRMSCYATPPGPGGAATGAWQTVAAPGVLPLRMALPPETGPTVVTACFDFRKSTGGPASRPALFGVRLVERP